MRIKIGDKAKPVVLTGIDGRRFDTRRLQGKAYMLSFFRFASCPFCNLRMHELVKRHNELEGNLPIVAVFDSPLGNLKKYAGRYKAPFPVLADESNSSYQDYAIEKSVLGVARGMVKRMPALLGAMLVKGYVPLTIKGSMTTMPADFLIDADGIVSQAYYGVDEGDHLPFDEVRRYARQQVLQASAKVGRKPVSVAG